ncbi:MAG: helix-turn-helix domain-containing protein [Cellvibrionaceae bacterium]
MKKLPPEHNNLSAENQTLIAPLAALDSEECYAAMQAHDFRFDGVFFVAVSTTKIYCRPICRVRLPKLDRCTFYHNAASAEQAGYRPCLRCRPELAPGNAQMDAVKRVAQMAASRIKAGALSDNNVEALAKEFGISDRQLRRSIETEYGVSPVNLAQTYRLLLAKQLLTDTQLKITDVAFASGFSSVRRFNDAFKTKYRLNPSALRKSNTVTNKRKNNSSLTSEQGIILRLGYRPPIAWSTLIHFLCSRGNSRVDCIQKDKKGNDVYYKTVSITVPLADPIPASIDKESNSNQLLSTTTGWISAIQDEKRHQIIVELSHNLLPHLVSLQIKLRELFDLDANPTVIEKHLGRDKKLKKIINENSGIRIAGTLDGFELALRAVLGQQISVKAATTVFGRFVDKFGDDVETPVAGLDKTSPNPAAIAKASIEDIIGLGLTQRRAATVKALAVATVDSTIPWGSSDHEFILKRLLDVSGIGPWTAQYVAMRALREPNAFPESDLGLMKALNVEKPVEVLAHAKKWAPWRAYGAIYLWTALSAGG